MGQVDWLRLSAYNRSMTDSRLAVILETINDNFKAVLESVGQMQDQMKLLATKAELQAGLDEIKTIKLAVTETNKHVAGHERRINRLEAKAL